MTTIREFDHSVLAVNDMILTQRFYGEVVSQIVECTIDHPTMMTTEEIIRAGRLRARRATHGAEEDRAFRVAAPHAAVKVGQALIPLFIYGEHVQEPPPEQLRGTPRLAIELTAEQMQRAVETFKRHKVPCEGPVEHALPSPIVCSLYFKDPASNFLEFCCSR